jgi:hypothetical protein
MPRRSKALLDRAERANQSALPVVVFVYGDPEPARLLGRSLGEREAIIGGELFAAKEGETIKAFHRRVGKIARERGGTGVTVISIGDDEPVKECLFNLDGTLKMPPVEAEPPGDATSH